jgi:outer membrane protein
VRIFEKDSRMRRSPLVLALALAVLPAAGAHAEDLLQTYQLARTGDPQIAGAEASQRAIREGESQARAAMLPQIGGDASYTRSRGDTTNTAGATVGDTSDDTTIKNFGVSLNQMVFDYGRISQLRSQRALTKSSEFQLDSAGDSLITRTSAAYFNVLVAIESLAAAETQETALKKQFDFASKRLEVGLAPITDVHEARARYDSARANTILVRNTLKDAYQALAEITGKEIRNLKGLPANFQPALPEQGDEDAWVANAVAHNPALQAQQYQLQSAEADISTARSGHLPTLYFGGSYGDTRRDGSTTNNLTDAVTDFESRSKDRSVGLTLSVPIFSGGAVQSQVRQAIARRDIASDDYETQKRALERNTRNAYQTLVAGISEIEARRLAVVSAQSAYDASQVGLEVGTRTVLDVLQNQQNLFNAQLEYARSRYNFLQSRLLLEQSAGTLEVADVEDVNRLLTADAESQLAPGDIKR